MLVKSLNPYNGNICFVGAVEDKDFIFEYDLNGGYTYAESPYFVKSLLCINVSTYLISFYNSNQIHAFSGGLISFVCSTSFTEVSQMENSNDGNFYILSNTDNTLAKVTLPSFFLLYGVYLPDPVNGNGKISAADNRIIYNNYNNAYLFEDNGLSFTTIRGMNIGDGSSMASCIIPSNATYPAYTRIRTVEIESSSSEEP